MEEAYVQERLHGLREDIRWRCCSIEWVEGAPERALPDELKRSAARPVKHIDFLRARALARVHFGYERVSQLSARRQKGGGRVSCWLQEGVRMGRTNFARRIEEDWGHVAETCG